MDCRLTPCVFGTNLIDGITDAVTTAEQFNGLHCPGYHPCSGRCRACEDQKCHTNEGTFVERIWRLTSNYALLIALAIGGDCTYGQEVRTTPQLALADDFPSIREGFQFATANPTHEIAIHVEASVNHDSVDRSTSVDTMPDDTMPTVEPNFRFQPLVAQPTFLDEHSETTLDKPMQPWWSQEFAAVRATDSPVSAHPGEFLAAFVGKPWELEPLLWLALEHSPYVKSILIEPQILQTRAVAINGQFDPQPFVDSIFHDSSDPVGNTLITGSANRLNEHVWDNRSGIRAKNTRGGETEFSQQFMFKDNNSDFFVPNDQADTKMFLRYTQPLMRGRGEVYNQSSFAIASLVANQSSYDVSSKIQKHAYDISVAYWELYANRACYAQTERGIKRLVELKEQLAGRSDIDSLRSQLLRGDAAIAKQSAAQARFLAQIKTSEANLRSAVGAPELLDRSQGDVIPATPTSDWLVETNRNQELTTALEYHPDVQAIRFNLQAARRRLQVAEHELRPTLDLVLESYLRGLNGDFDAAKSFGEQFTEGAPSYAAGLSFARPYRNVAAKAALRERRLELQRVLLQLENQLLVISADVESALAGVEAANVQLQASIRSTLATHAELEYLTARWQNAFLDGTQSSLLLDQLLNAEIQIIQSENAWARAQADHMIAMATLRLANGTLLPFTPPMDASVVH